MIAIEVTFVKEDNTSGMSWQMRLISTITNENLD
jgi:hypothetical protein